jgi:hypothetical protein
MFTPPAGSDQFDRLLNRIRAGEEEDSRLWLNNGDTIRGRLLRLDDQWTTVRALNQDTRVPTDQIATLVFATRLEPEVPRNGVCCLLGFRDGSMLCTLHAELADGQMHATTVGGLRVSSQTYVDMQYETVMLQTLRGGVTYLSDLRPLGFRHQPFLSLKWPLGVDRSVTGGQLRVRGTIYDKGLGMSSASRLAYRLDDPYQRFVAELAIDDGAGQGGSVVCRVFVDAGQGRWRQAYASPAIRGGDEPVTVSVNLSDAVALALVVDYGERADQLDHVNWLDARLVPRGSVSSRIPGFKQ